MFEENKSKGDDIKYTRFISNSPCGEDLFASKSLEKIANNISNILKNEKENNCKIIGIDGGWGSGKSNLVTLIRNKLKSEKFHFFIYDAWGHQEDFQRRSILEELTEDLTSINKILIEKKWEDNLKQLLSKTTETESKTIPSLSFGIVISGVILVLTPVFKILSDNFKDFGWKLFIVGVPFLIFILLYLFSLISVCLKEKEEKKKNKEEIQKKNLWQNFKKNWWPQFKELSSEAFKELFYLYQKEQIGTVNFEKISEDEPSVRKFRNYFEAISNDLVKIDTTLVIVFDNMDRLPKPKVQDLWSSIHTFFAEGFYENVVVIIPFDRKHIQLAFDQEGNSYGNDFINKTFNVVYRVSPPILSDWKMFFKQKWEEAFQNNYNAEDYENVIQIYDILSQDITPRRMIAFINEFVSTQQIQPDIPGEYVALFILKKSDILSKPFEEIIKPTYLKGVEFIFEDDENLAKNIGALVYQIEAEKAIQVIYTDKLTRALNNNNDQDAKTISQSNEFDDILKKSASSVSNVGNAILCLNNLDKEINPLIWENLYRKIKDESPEASKVKDYQKILLQKIIEKNNYLKRLINELINAEKFNAVDYFSSISDLENLDNEKSLELSIKEKLPKKQTSVVDFIAFLKVAKDKQKDYYVNCNKEELVIYLAQLPVTIEELEKVDFIPYIIPDYNLEKYVQKLEEAININKTVPSNLTLMGWLYKRYKEAFKSKPVSLILDPQFVSSFFNQLDSGEEFYFDLIAMRISKSSSMPQQFANAIDSVLNSNDNTIVDKLVEQIEYYISYNDLLLNIQYFSKFPTCLEVVKKLTTNSIKGSELNLVQVLQNFKTICESGIDPEILIKRLNYIQDQKSGITNENIKSTIPHLLFFENGLKVENDLTLYCITLLEEYLNKISIDEWKEFLKNENSYEFQASILLKDYQYKQQMVDAIKATLYEIADKIIPIPGKENWSKILEKLEKQSLFNAFQDLRDRFCSQTEVTEGLFLFFGDWLFEYGELENRSEVTRRIFLTGILRNEDCLKVLTSHLNKLEQIIKNSEKNGKEEFKSIILSLLTDEGTNEQVQIIADKIGIKKEKKKDKGKD